MRVSRCSSGDSRNEKMTATRVVLRDSFGRETSELQSGQIAADVPGRGGEYQSRDLISKESAAEFPQRAIFPPRVPESSTKARIPNLPAAGITVMIVSGYRWCSERTPGSPKERGGRVSSACGGCRLLF